METTWKKQTHPEIADAYAYVRPGDSVKDRLQRVEDLAKMRANHPEGAVALAKVAIDAQEWEIARDALKRVFRTNPTQQAFLLMSELEEAEHGDRGRVREWLARAVRAPQDPAWTADGVVSEEWAPISPVTGRLDAFEWKVPLEDLGDHPGSVIEESMLDKLPPPLEPQEPEEPAINIDEIAEDADIVQIDMPPEEILPTPAAPAEDSVVVPESEAASTVTESSSDEAKDKADIESEADGETIETDAKDEGPVLIQTDDANAEPQAPTDSTPSNGLDPLPADFPLNSRPDDPGPKPKAEPKEKKAIQFCFPDRA